MRTDENSGAAWNILYPVDNSKPFPGKTLHFLRIVDRHSDGIDSSIASGSRGSALFNAFLQTFYGPLNTEAKTGGGRSLNYPLVLH